MTDAMYPLAPQGVFHTIQGEGTLLGMPSVFIRLGGCPVGCPECDTDYSAASQVSASDIAQQAASLATANTRWAWITGGEPTIHSLRPLIGALKRARLFVAVATAGIKVVPRDSEGPDFVSVSPHRLDQSWVQRRGEQLNLVFGLNGLDWRAASLPEWLHEFQSGFGEKFVTPCDSKPETLEICLGWVNRYPGYRLGVQAHKAWGLA